MASPWNRAASAGLIEEDMDAFLQKISLNAARSSLSMSLSSLPAAASETGPSKSADTSLHGRWLLMARVSWIVVTLVILTLNAVMIPRYDTILQAPCQSGAPCFGLQLTPDDRQFLHQSGLSLSFVTGYQVLLV